jgi:hypothetical protein
MNVVLWIVQSVLALLLVAGGGYKLFGGAELAAQFSLLPALAWRALGAIEVVGGLLLVLPLALRWKPELTSRAAVVLLVEALGLSALYGSYSTALSAENPLVWSVMMALLLAFVAYGRWGTVSGQSR